MEERAEGQAPLDVVLVVCTRGISKRSAVVAHWWSQNPTFQRGLSQLPPALTQRFAGKDWTKVANQSCTRHGQLLGILRVRPGMLFADGLASSTKEARAQHAAMERDSRAYTVTVSDSAFAVDHLEVTSATFGIRADHNNQPLFPLTLQSCQSLLQCRFQVSRAHPDRQQTVTGAQLIQQWVPAAADVSLCVALVEPLGLLLVHGLWAELALSGRWRVKERLFKQWPPAHVFEYGLDEDEAADEEVSPLGLLIPSLYIRI